MDFITSLHKSKGNNVIMVVVDKLTKYANFCALSHPFKAIIVTTTFMDTIQKLHENPRVIVSDKDLFLLEIFGRSYFLVWVLNYPIAHFIILNLMVKLR